MTEPVEKFIYQIREQDVKELGYLMNYLNSTKLNENMEIAFKIEMVLKNIIGLKGE